MMRLSGALSALATFSQFTATWGKLSASTSIEILAVSGTAPKEFDFDLTWEKHAPDGYSKYMFLINGQSPGPVLEVEQGDVVVVRVHNKSPFNSTIHFHGIEMYGTPWSDGVPGVSQRPIYPGNSFEHRFQATQYGSYWYHSHLRGQIEDGLMGPIVIHPRKGAPNPFHLISNKTASIRAMEQAERRVKPLLISDVTHLTSNEKWDMTIAANFEDSCYDSIIFNGKGSVQCLDKNEVDAHLSPTQHGLLGIVPGATMTDKSCLPAKVMIAIGGPNAKGNESALLPGVYEGCKATKGSVEVISTRKSTCSEEKWMAFDIIGGINFITAAISIDEHDMWVYAMDGSYIEPQKVQALILTNGDRYSILVKPRKAGDFQIRCNAVSAPQIIVGHALLHVEGKGAQVNSSKPFIDISGAPTSKDVVYFNQKVAAPYPADPVAPKADQLYVLDMKIDGASYLWALNNTRLMPVDLDSEVPLLFKPEFNKQNNVTISTHNGTWIDLVLYASMFNMPPHPIHKHGNKMFALGSGTGEFKWSSVEEAARELPGQFNLVNPPRGDTFATPQSSSTDTAWAVFRYQVVNPGPWLLHCHISNHMMGGMMAIVQDGIDKWPVVPQSYLDYET